MNTPLLQVENLRAGYGPVMVLKGISLQVNEDEIVTLIGANGAGKTTTLRCLSGCLRPQTGSIRFAGQPIHGLAAHEVVRRGLLHSPEGRRVFPRLTVLENLQMGAYTRSDRAGVAADLERAFDLFPILRERQRQAAGTLSGGEQQMLAVARALLGRPRLLLLDEPSLGLAPLIVLRIFDVIRQLNRDGLAVLLVEQNARLALQLAHRGHVLESGSVSLKGPADVLRHEPLVRQAYLGG
jgi:branched-chain amino acid transport system ATP-binding protein